MVQSVYQHIYQRSNDYSQLEAAYHHLAGAPMVDDPYASILHPLAEITLSASIVIPAWNAADSIERCLLAIEQSSFNQKYHNQLEVIVVDDGSQDETWQLLERTHFNLHLKAFHQENHGRSQARNTAIAMSEGDIIICCDSDMVLSTFAIEELMKRHQLCDQVLLLGFRTPVPSDIPDFQLENLSQTLKEQPCIFYGDTRINHPIGYWGLCRETDHLKQLGQGKCICRPTGLWRDLPVQVYGLLFSLPRHNFLAMQGYDEGFHGWGYEDLMVGAHAVAQGTYVIPVYAAAGWHISHEERNPSSHKRDHKHWNEYARNQVYYHQRLHAPLPKADSGWQKRARQRILKSLEHHPSSAHTHEDLDPSYYEYYHNAPRNLVTFGFYYFQVGRYQEAAQILSGIRGTEEEEFIAAMLQGKALRMAGCIDEAVTLLKSFASSHPLSLSRENAYMFASAFIDYALALAAQGRFIEARQQLRRADEFQPDNLQLHYLRKRPISFHTEQLRIYLRQHDYTHALQACEAALILEPSDLELQRQRSCLLASREKREATGKAQHIDTANTPIHSLPNSHRSLSQTWASFAGNRQEPAQAAALEQPRQRCADTIDVARELLTLHTEGECSLDLPTLVQQVQTIPGVFTADELTFLITLTLQAMIAHNAEEPGLCIDTNSYCGRSTVAMGLALRGAHCHDQSKHIVSMYQPGVEPVEYGPMSLPTSRELFQQVLWQYELNEQVLCIPEQGSLPQKRVCRLLLVEGTSNHSGLPQDITQTLTTLAPGGFVLAYPYAPTHPDIQLWVDTLLREKHYILLSQVEQLIALQAPLESGEEPSC